MHKAQIQLPDPLYRRLKGIAKQQDCSLSEVMRKAAEHFVARFPKEAKSKEEWSFPTIDCDEFLTDPAKLSNSVDRR